MRNEPGAYLWKNIPEEKRVTARAPLKYICETALYLEWREEREIVGDGSER